HTTTPPRPKSRWSTASAGEGPAEPESVGTPSAPPGVGRSLTDASAAAGPAAGVAPRPTATPIPTPIANPTTTPTAAAADRESQRTRVIDDSGPHATTGRTTSTEHRTGGPSHAHALRSRLSPLDPGRRRPPDVCRDDDGHRALRPPR